MGRRANKVDSCDEAPKAFTRPQHRSEAINSVTMALTATGDFQISMVRTEPVGWPAIARLQKVAYG